MSKKTIQPHANFSVLFRYDSIRFQALHLEYSEVATSAEHPVLLLKQAHRIPDRHLQLRCFPFHAFDNTAPSISPRPRIVSNMLSSSFNKSSFFLINVPFFALAASILVSLFSLKKLLLLL